MSTPSAAEDFWDQCQHQSWFFVSWHRGYVAAFEAVIANTIAGLGGPADWALPYWNYSEDLSKNPKARLMPPDFFEKTIDGKPNALFSRRSRASNGDFGLDASVVTLKALKMRNFANSVPGRPSGFGGPVTGFNTGGGDNGGLENLPHNAVHGQIGGFMNDPRHRRARPDILAASLQHRPALGGLAQSGRSVQESEHRGLALRRDVQHA